MEEGRWKMEANEGRRERREGRWEMEAKEKRGRSWGIMEEWNNGEKMGPWFFHYSNIPSFPSSTGMI